jgi:hypothetical protein
MSATPGPLYAKRNAKNWAVYDGYGECVAVVGGSGFAAMDLRHQSNAMLFAAAPALLHCLKVICSHAEGRPELEVALHLDVARSLIVATEAA